MSEVTPAVWRGFALALGLSALGCSAGEPGGGSEGAGMGRAETRSTQDREPMGLTIPEDVRPVDYTVFQSTTVSETPRKTVVRIVGMESAGTLELGRTLEVALDSLGRADSIAVAIRAILYVIQAEDRVHGRLVPRIWGEWLPASGWTDASPGARQEPHAISVYGERPGWHGDVAPRPREVNDG